MTERTPPLNLQAGTYTAEDDRRFVSSLYGDSEGIIMPTDLVVTQRGAGANMSVDVAGGRAVVKGDLSTYEGAYWMENRGVTNLVISASDPTNPRIDRIIAEVLNAEYSGASNLWQLRVMTGTPAGAPVAPAIPNNAISLATVSVAALASSITNANITDLRTRAWMHQSTITCTSTTRPSAPFEGMRIYETDTDFEYIYSGTAWIQTAHLGALTGYTPTWVQSATINKTIAYAKSMKLGRWCQGSVLMTATSAGVANNAITVTTPYTAAGGSATVVGAGWFQNAALDGGRAVGYYGGILTLLNSTTFAFIPTLNGIDAFVGQTNSSNFDNAIQANDKIAFHFAYETAS